MVRNWKSDFVLVGLNRMIRQGCVLCQSSTCKMASLALLRSASGSASGVWNKRVGGGALVGWMRTCTAVGGSGSGSGSAIGIRGLLVPASSFSLLNTNNKTNNITHAKPRPLNSPLQTKPNFFSTTTAKMTTTSTTFIDLLKTRRTIYQLKNSSPIPDAKIQEIVEQALLHVPSSFNSQSTRIVLLFKGEHEKLWDIAHDVLKGVVPEAQFEGTAQKLQGFRAGYGTILFFEDRSVVSKMQAAFSTYADKFPIWATQSDAMTQYAIWVALEAEGLGANLQHYNPLIDAKVAETWNIPADWELNAQLVFGAPVAPAGSKDFMPLEQRFKVFGA
ncbi:nitroreductase protein [Rutstroemia sp. NJR-2017a BVV2]|nr:nitroreductase protein [Rutstroemia sp. NJR-2017a BVV2]